MEIKCTYCGHEGPQSDNNKNKVLMGVAFHCPKCNRDTPHYSETDGESASSIERIASTTPGIKGELFRLSSEEIAEISGALGVALNEEQYRDEDVVVRLAKLFNKETST